MEVLSPAGNMECFKAAIQGLADAIYIGGKNFGARAFSSNFTNEEIVLAIKEEVNIPVKFVGMGEKMEDLETFDIENYIYGLFKDMIK